MGACAHYFLSDFTRKMRLRFECEFLGQFNCSDWGSLFPNEYHFSTLFQKKKIRVKEHAPIGESDREWNCISNLVSRPCLGPG